MNFHPSKSHCCSSHNFQVLMQSQHSNSNQDNCFLLVHKLFCFLSIPFQLQRVLCPAHQNRGFQNQPMEREWRIVENMELHPHLMNLMVDFAFDANSWVTSRKIVLSYSTALNARLKVTSQQCVLQRNRVADSRKKSVKVLT